MDDLDLRKEIVRICRRMRGSGLVTGTEGNVSARTPTGTSSQRVAGLYAQKGGRVATEREEFEREAWRVMVAWAVEPERLIFVDECGLHTLLAPIYGYAPRSKEALVEAIGVALSAVSAADARGFFEHAGYHPMGHLL